MSNHQNKTNGNNTKNNNDKVIISCRNCGKVNKIKQCPAKDKPCNKCNKIGHFANKCRSSPSVFFKVHRSRDWRESHSPSHTKVPN